MSPWGSYANFPIRKIKMRFCPHHFSPEYAVVTNTPQRDKLSMKPAELTNILTRALEKGKLEATSSRELDVEEEKATHTSLNPSLRQ